MRFYIIDEKNKDVVADMDTLKGAMDFIEIFDNPDFHIYDERDYEKFKGDKK